MSASARISELGAHVGAAVTVRGWVTHLRSSGKVAFIVLRDGTGILQTVLVKNQVSSEVWDRFAALTQESCLAVTGEVKPDARAPGGYELGLTNVEIVLAPGQPSPVKALADAEAHAREALRLDDSLASAHAALGHCYWQQWKWDEADREFQKALAGAATRRRRISFMACIWRRWAASRRP